MKRITVLILVITVFLCACKSTPGSKSESDASSNYLVAGKVGEEIQSESKNEETSSQETVTNQETFTNSNESSKETPSNNKKDESKNDEGENNMKSDLPKISGPVCALTFDDGPSNTTTQILDVLEKYGCTASFFIVGKWAVDEGDIEIMQRAVKMGCTIENHTWEHKNLCEMSVDEITEAYKSVQDYVFKAVGSYPQFFRAPGLSVNSTVFDTIPLTFINGYGGSSEWNSDENDPATADLETRVKGILNAAKDGHIYLLHDSPDNHLTVEALNIALPQLIKQGYTFVNIRELFNIKYQELTPGIHEAWTDVPMNYTRYFQIHQQKK